MQVDDVMAFFDGYGIDGEVGDMLRIGGVDEDIPLVKIDYANRVLVLGRAVRWPRAPACALCSGQGPLQGDGGTCGRQVLWTLPANRSRFRSAAWISLKKPGLGWRTGRLVAPLDSP